MTEADQKELAELRAEKADRLNPNVLLLEGELGSGEGEYSALSVKTDTGLVYIAEVLEELVSWKGTIMTFQFHVASEPLSFHALQEDWIKTVMGLTTASFTHSYSDLTGYLWTNESIKAGGHDVLKEITDMMRPIEYPNKRYIALRVEKQP